MRVLTLCYEWPPVGGGGGRAAKEIAEALARRGHQVRVQTIRFNETPAHEVAAKVDVYRTRGFRRRADQCTPLEMAGYVLSSAIPTLRHLAEFKPDLIPCAFCGSDRGLSAGKRPPITPTLRHHSASRRCPWSDPRANGRAVSLVKPSDPAHLATGRRGGRRQQVCGRPCPESLRT
jgi:glycosyltransferase involved in cell wall biosynthesis